MWANVEPIPAEIVEANLGDAKQIMTAYIEKRRKDRWPLLKKAIIYPEQILEEVIWKGEL